MSKLLESPLVARYLAATAGRNMTKAAYVAVTAGVVLMVVLTIDPAYMALHRWVDALLFACLVFFIFEWVVRLRQAIMAQPAPHNTRKYFITTTFNYPTMAEAYRVAALNGIDKLF